MNEYKFTMKTGRWGKWHQITLRNPSIRESMQIPMELQYRGPKIWIIYESEPNVSLYYNHVNSSTIGYNREMCIQRVLFLRDKFEEILK